MWIHKNTSIIALIVALTVLSLFVCGCPNNSGNTQSGQKPVTEANDTGSSDNQDNTSNINETAENGENQDQDDRSSSIPPPMEGTEHPSLEELQTVTKYGPFIFPDSEYMQDKSRYQSMGDAEIYNLEFGTVTNYTAVVGWYKDSVSPDYEITDSRIPTGQYVTTFTYQSEDPNYHVSIVVQGHPDGDATTIHISILGYIDPVEQEPEE